MTDPIDIPVNADIFRAMAVEQEDEWREFQKVLAAMPGAEFFELDDEEEGQKAAQRMAKLDVVLDAMREREQT